MSANNPPREMNAFRMEQLESMGAKLLAIDENRLV